MLVFGFIPVFVLTVLLKFAKLEYFSLVLFSGMCKVMALIAKTVV